MNARGSSRGQAEALSAPPGDDGCSAQGGTGAYAVAGVTTRDTVLLGFGLEHVPDAAQRARLVADALRAPRR
ncbi:hypothetical protein [Streptomyces antimycoticus]|uniref:hypothetical protein n=1 Tax=Streptomyces antimycoticus TaxID=68175 RepID=UPI00386CA330|nr:hypothetical protein OG751_14315 [Streptomyces antimycoticus]